MGEEEVTTFLSYLATKRWISTGIAYELDLRGTAIQTPDDDRSVYVP